jgi:hypothetical protein
MSQGAARALAQQHARDIKDLFAEPLAARLGRTAAEIRERGLGAGDFRCDGHIDLTLCDGSTMSLQYAFAVVDVERRIVGVFTEHCGYFCFGTVDLRLDERRDGKVIRYAW